MDMMEESQRKNAEALNKIVRSAFRHTIEFASPEETFSNPELVRIAKGKNTLEGIANLPSAWQEG